MGRKYLSKSKRYDVLRRDGFRCGYCGARGGDVEFHIDHKVPVSEGGSNKMDNLVTACRHCNLGKGTKPADPPDEAGEVIDGVRLKVHFRWAPRPVETRLWLYYEVEGEPITDDYASPDDITPVELLRIWVSRNRERREDSDLVPIDWYVVGEPPIGLERMPPDRRGDFLEHFGHPKHPITGERVPFEALPLQRKRWRRGARVTKGGFIQEALRWTPSVRQAGISLNELHRLALRRLGEATNLDARIRAAEAVQAFRPSGTQFDPIPLSAMDEIEWSYGDAAAWIDETEAANLPGPIL